MHQCQVREHVSHLSHAKVRGTKRGNWKALYIYVQSICILVLEEKALYICAIYLHTGFRRIARLAILTPLKSSSNPTDSVHVHICVCVCTTLRLCSNPTDSVYACMCMCVPVCKFIVTGVGKRSHLSVPTLMVLLLACLSVRK